LAGAVAPTGKAVGIKYVVNSIAYLVILTVSSNG
jgi:hypothetical protein